MKQLITVCAITTFIFIVAGCASDGPKREKGPDGTVAYMVEVDSSQPGARIEADGDYVGQTPVTIKIFGDDDRTFHNFGSYHYKVTAYPVTHGEPQTKDFRTGGWFTPEDRIPSKMYFDFGPATSTTENP